MPSNKRVILPVLFALAVSGFSFSGHSAQMPTDQQRTFRAWMVTIVEDQISHGANPRWQHRDCAGLVRFAVGEALATHDDHWRKSNGFLGRPLPAEVELSAVDRKDFKLWRQSEGPRSNFARALPLIQQNTIFLGKTPDHPEPGDLLFFDQGDEQHIMIWTGQRIVYHNGHRLKKGEATTDNGLRAVSLGELFNWSDSRWQPRATNPNFVGYFRLAFLQPTSERGSL